MYGGREGASMFKKDTSTIWARGERILNFIEYES